MPSSPAIRCSPATLVVQQRNDEQHGVGTHDAGVVEVRRRDREILAQYGKPTAARASFRSSALPPK